MSAYREEESSDGEYIWCIDDPVHLTAAASGDLTEAIAETSSGDQFRHSTVSLHQRKKSGLKVLSIEFLQGSIINSNNLCW
jgi:hypothetical protein